MSDMKPSKVKTQMIHTRLTESLYEALKDKADKHNITLSQMVRMVLKKAASPKTKISVEVQF